MEPGLQKEELDNRELYIICPYRDIFLASGRKQIIKNRK
jgi:hypothetical protein